LHWRGLVEKAESRSTRTLLGLALLAAAMAAPAVRGDDPEKSPKPLSAREQIKRMQVKGFDICSAARTVSAYGADDLAFIFMGALDEYERSFSAGTDYARPDLQAVADARWRKDVQEDFTRFFCAMSPQAAASARKRVKEAGGDDYLKSTRSLLDLVELLDSVEALPAETDRAVVLHHFFSAYVEFSEGFRLYKGDDVELVQESFKRLKFVLINVLSGRLHLPVTARVLPWIGVARQLAAEAEVKEQERRKAILENR
jgi:hypothetical protein